jgi:Uma2 family endonuclease
MSTITRRPPRPPGWIPSPLARLTVDQYEAMVKSGVFTERDRFHLINGYLVAKVTKNPPHACSTDLTADALRGAILAGWCVRAENPICLPPDSEPEPDVAVARGVLKDYGRRHPRAAELALVVEVSDATLKEDRELVDVYGPAGIPVSWIVDLNGRRVEVYTLSKRRGGAARYGKPRVFTARQFVPVVIDGVEVGRIAVTDILPEPEPPAGGNGA